MQPVDTSRSGSRCAASTEPHIVPQSIARNHGQRTLTDLPNELLVTIFKHLNGRDLRSMRCVNQRVNCILLEERLLYRHGEFTRLGLRFPGALRSTPFLQLPELGITPVAPSDGVRILDNLQRLQLRPHAPTDCVLFHITWGGFLAEISACRNVSPALVLSIELLNPDPEASIPDDEVVAERDRLGALLHTVSEDVFRSDSDDFRALQFSAVSPGFPGQDTYGKIGCCYLDHTIVNDDNVDLRKLVIRNAPVMFYNASPNHLTVPSRLYAEEQYVLVVNSACLWKDSPSDCCLGFDMGWEDVQWGMGPQPVAGIQELVIVFWTGDPDTPWIPPCYHSTASPRSRPELESSSEGCIAMRHILGGMMLMLQSFHTAGKREVRITLVNIKACVGTCHRTIRPDDQDPLSPEDYLQTQHAEWFDECNTKFPTIFLPTMQEWIDSGDADDVFASHELAPFLTTPANAE
ncbi:hypothetical protein A1Q2_05759 [Trichosporon asahii var. asahii CBS 8904]|uniref:F-box domain-containing protein n=1 Tax=Trichosporon asahii var. asahii (strain CBS 8904) TaxID=1220162 RepID=K1VGH4_TRIAC|nr:hypothetical protein A1Q2_05759 [Trichosporon asahii var. asahii CBS 8904]